MGLACSSGVKNLRFNNCTAQGRLAKGSIPYRDIGRTCGLALATALYRTATATTALWVGRSQVPSARAQESRPLQAVRLSVGSW